MRTITWLILILIVICILAIPFSMHAQCAGSKGTAITKLVVPALVDSHGSSR
jgi:hypothetical protein